jgi:hypothetical protein
MKITISKILSIPVALAYVLFFIVSFVKSDSDSVTTNFLLGVLMGSMVSLPPLLCIWFPEVIGEMILWPGFHHVADISGKLGGTPPFLISFLGWVWLVGTVVFVVVIRVLEPVLPVLDSIIGNLGTPPFWVSFIGWIILCIMVLPYFLTRR